MKRTPNLNPQLAPTVHISAVPELAHRRERFMDAERVRKQKAAAREAGTGEVDSGGVTSAA